jgi:SPFH domain / Band 7 family
MHVGEDDWLRVSCGRRLVGDHLGEQGMEFLVISMIVAGLLVLVAPRFIPPHLSVLNSAAKAVAVLLILFAVASTSFVYIDEDKTGHINKIYGSNLPQGAYIAVNGEKGPQAHILPPGFQFSPLLNLLNHVKEEAIVQVPEGQYAYLVARDGSRLPTGQSFAEAFEPDMAEKMITNSAFFLTNGGYKGPQTTVLTPGVYRLNRYLWAVQYGPITEIEKGFVGVMQSNVWSRVDFGALKAEKPESCVPSIRKKIDSSSELGQPVNPDKLVVNLVPVGCSGIWDTVLGPGKYFVNKAAYTVTPVDTRVQAWEYKGGYQRRWIDLTVDQAGKINQTLRTETVAVPKEVADSAVFVKVEGWDVPLELRALVQVTPANAPFVVAAVGGLEEVEDRILTPAIRSIVRNVMGGNIHVEVPVLDDQGNPVPDAAGNPRTKKVTRPTHVMDLIENREVLESNVEEAIRPEGWKAGVEIKEVRFGEPVIPPELLVARQREQLAKQLKTAYTEERVAQTERIEAEQAKATADQQSRLVESQIEVKRSEQFKIARANEGMGERDKLNYIAEGQKSQAQVLGETRVVELRKFELIVDRLLSIVQAHPEILTTALSNAHKFVPDRVITVGGEGTGGSSLPGAMSILGDMLSPGKTVLPAK